MMEGPGGRLTKVMFLGRLLISSETLMLVTCKFGLMFLSHFYSRILNVWFDGFQLIECVVIVIWYGIGFGARVVWIDDLQVLDQGDNLFTSGSSDADCERLFTVLMFLTHMKYEQPQRHGCVRRCTLGVRKLMACTFE